MDSSLIGKIDKAKRYAEEKDRVSINTFDAVFHGNHNTYQVLFHSGKWQCECAFFTTRSFCCHTMALQRILEDVLGKTPLSTEAN